MTQKKLLPQSDQSSLINYRLGGERERFLRDDDGDGERRPRLGGEGERCERGDDRGGGDLRRGDREEGEAARAEE